MTKYRLQRPGQNQLRNINNTLLACQQVSILGTMTAGETAPTTAPNGGIQHGYAKHSRSQQDHTEYFKTGRQKHIRTAGRPTFQISHIQG